MTTDQMTEAPPAPSLHDQLREFWLAATSRRRQLRDLETTRKALTHLDDHMRRDIGLGPKEQALLSRTDIIVQLHR